MGRGSLLLLLGHTDKLAGGGAVGELLLGVQANHRVFSCLCFCLERWGVSCAVAATPRWQSVGAVGSKPCGDALGGVGCAERGCTVGG